MIGALIGTTIASGLLGAAGSMASSAIQGEYNKAEAQANRDFQERMSNTAIQRQFADARKAGISPAMLLGQASQPMGNSASIGQPDLGGIMANTVNKIADIMREDRRLDAMEELQEDKLNALQAMQNERLEHATQMKMSSSANKFIHRKDTRTREEWNSFFQKPEDIKL